MTTKVAILISGSGSNMVALLDSMEGDHPARPVLVMSNNPEAGGLKKARERGVETAVVDHRKFHGDRGAFEKALHERLEKADADIVCLAGFMRILEDPFVGRWDGRMINIHPSLLPKYPGLTTHARALENGDAQAGCTVHEVTSELDGGPVLGQSRVKIEEDDTPETLAARVLAEEHILYPAVLRRFASGNKSPIFRP